MTQQNGLDINNQEQNKEKLTHFNEAGEAHMVDVHANGIVKFEGDIKTEALEIFKASGLNRYYVMSADELRVIYLTK